MKGRLTEIPVSSARNALPAEDSEVPRLWTSIQTKGTPDQPQAGLGVPFARRGAASRLGGGALSCRGLADGHQASVLSRADRPGGEPVLTVDDS